MKVELKEALEVLADAAMEAQDAYIEKLAEAISEIAEAKGRPQDGGTYIPVSGLHEVRGVNYRNHDGKPYFVIEIKDGIRIPRDASMFTLKHIADWMQRV